MSRLEMSLLRSAAVVAVVVFSCSLAVAAEQNADIEIAETTFASTGVSWQPAVSFESAALTVSGPGDLSLHREFAAGEALVFRVDDANQAALEDGQYAWELRFSPVTDAVVKEALRAARASGDTSEIEDLKKQGRLPAEPLVISGYFRVQGGSIIVANDAEASTRRGGERVGATGSKQTVDTDSGVPTKDQVILDDLIVDGSICAGMDCVNGESFGFDTIRIKENNLRIRAVDTSSTSSFPSRDWQITFNDSANGGANKFSIDDIDGGRTPFTLEAGAPSHSLYVDDGGRLGLGTSTPVVDIHVKTGNTPTLRLEQDGSSGFTPQTWDVAGNETNFFIRDATNGSTLPFRIRPSAPTSSIDIAADGDVGIGTASPGSELHVLLGGSPISAFSETGVAVQNTSSSTDWAGISIIGGTSGTSQLNFGHNLSETKGRIVYKLGTNDMDFYTKGSRRMRLTNGGKLAIGVSAVGAGDDLLHANGAHLTTGGVWSNASSRSYKENIQELSTEAAVNAVLDLDPVVFNYKRAPNEQYVGFIAEDVPALVAENDRKGLSALDVVAVLTKVVQEQQRQIDELSKQVEELQAHVDN